MQRRTFITGLSSLLVAGQAASLAHADQGFGLVEGVEYKRIPQMQSIAPHKKHVVEVFGYTCPHCYNLEPSIKAWKKTKPDDVHFEAMPAVFNNPNWIFMARVFYTAKELGVLEQAHGEFFHALHRDNKKLYSVEAIAKFFTQFGVKEQDFTNTFKGFKVDQHVRRAAKLTKSYGIEGVPAIIVNGKYLTDVSSAGSRDKLWKVVDELTLKK